MSSATRVGGARPVPTGKVGIPRRTCEVLVLSLSCPRDDEKAGWQHSPSWPVDQGSAKDRPKPWGEVRC